MFNGQRGPKDPVERIAIDCEAAGINRAAKLIRDQNAEIKALTERLEALTGRTKAKAEVLK